MEFQKLISFIKLKSKKSQLHISKIRQTVHPGDLYSIIGSHIHMSLNRIFRSENRLHELIIYDFMTRYYKSKIAQNKYRSL